MQRERSQVCVSEWGRNNRRLWRPLEAPPLVIGRKKVPCLTSPPSEGTQLCATVTLQRSIWLQFMLGGETAHLVLNASLWYWKSAGTEDVVAKGVFFSLAELCLLHCVWSQSHNLNWNLLKHYYTHPKLTILIIFFLKPISHLTIKTANFSQYVDGNYAEFPAEKMKKPNTFNHHPAWLRLKNWIQSVTSW